VVKEQKCTAYVVNNLVWIKNENTGGWYRAIYCYFVIFSAFVV